MRHKKSINHLGRTSSHRKSMISNMANSLILHKRITTTTAKAKALRTFVEPLITKSKEDSTHSRRIVFGYLKNKFAVSELFRDVAIKVGDRQGGYTRILKTGTRLGDNADMCIIELVDYNENLLGAKDTRPKTGKRRRAGKKKTSGEVVTGENQAQNTPVNKVQGSTVPQDEIVAEAKDATSEKSITEGGVSDEIGTDNAEEKNE